MVCVCCVWSIFHKKKEKTSFCFWSRGAEECCSWMKMLFLVQFLKMSSILLEQAEAIKG
jgi:hypothetical protein